jgi:hypothetical protein
MSSDDTQRTERPNPDDIAEAYKVYRDSHALFLRTLRRHARLTPPQEDVVFLAAADVVPVVRAVYVVSLGHDVKRPVCHECRAGLAQAMRLGMIVKCAEDDRHTLTEQGVETLRTWTEHVQPLKDHHARYAQIWNAVTGLKP